MIRFLYCFFYELTVKEKEMQFDRLLCINYRYVPALYKGKKMELRWNRRGHNKTFGLCISGLNKGESVNQSKEQGQNEENQSTHLYPIIGVGRFERKTATWKLVDLPKQTYMKKHKLEMDELEDLMRQKIRTKSFKSKPGTLSMLKKTTFPDLVKLLKEGGIVDIKVIRYKWIKLFDEPKFGFGDRALQTILVVKPEKWRYGMCTILIMQLSNSCDTLLI